MMQVYWLEQTEADVPAGNDWLGASEALLQNALRFAKRRTDWRLGRWAAKRALAAYLSAPDDFASLTRIEVRPAASGAPEVYLAGEAADVSISLSHRAGSALCAVAAAGAALGCDLELIEPRGTRFAADYFTSEEQALLLKIAPGDRPKYYALLWSAKESVLKALRTGLRMDTRSVKVIPADGARCLMNNWRPLYARCASGDTFRGWWQQTGQMLRTLVASPPAPPPVALRPHASNLEHGPYTAIDGRIRL